MQIYKLLFRYNCDNNIYFNYQKVKSLPLGRVAVEDLVRLPVDFPELLVVVVYIFSVFVDNNRSLKIFILVLNARTAVSKHYLEWFVMYVGIV